jgi:hypothetical protein
MFQKVNRLITTLDDEVAFEVVDDTLLPALNLNSKMDVIFNLKSIAAGSAQFSVEENFNGEWFTTAQSSVVNSAQAIALANANFPLLGKGVVPRFSVVRSGATGAFECDVYLSSYTF